MRARRNPVTLSALKRGSEHVMHAVDMENAGMTPAIGAHGFNRWLEAFVAQNRRSLYGHGVVIPEDKTGTIYALGCGSFGCVFPTTDPAVVVKITKDQSEGAYAEQIRRRQNIDWEKWMGFVRVHDVLRGPWLADYEKHPEPGTANHHIYLIIREAINPQTASFDDSHVVGWSTGFGAQYITYSYAEEAFLTAVEREIEIGPEALERELRPAVQRTENIRRSVHAAMWEFAFKPGDLHRHNMGMPLMRGDGQLVVHDFGSGSSRGVYGSDGGRRFNPRRKLSRKARVAKMVKRSKATKHLLPKRRFK